METTYRVTVMHLLRVAPIRKTTHEGVTGLEEAISLGRENAPIFDEDSYKERRAELAVTGSTSWSYGFTDVAIEREAQAATQDN